jgi:hypothetical protein
MTGSILSHDQLLDLIIAFEERMFVAVKTPTPSDLQQKLKTFRTMRRMAHSVLSDETLTSYLRDLRDAATQGECEDCYAMPKVSKVPLTEKGFRRNFFTEKYARIDEQIPPINDNPLIDEIVGIEAGWFNELVRRYPRLFAATGYFERYAHAELETYSDRTLALHVRDVRAARDAGRNLVEERYNYLCKVLNVGTLADAEALPVPASLHPQQEKAVAS